MEQWLFYTSYLNVFPSINYEMTVKDTATCIRHGLPHADNKLGSQHSVCEWRKKKLEGGWCVREWQQITKYGWEKKSELVRRTHRLQYVTSASMALAHLHSDLQFMNKVLLKIDQIAIFTSETISLFRQQLETKHHFFHMLLAKSQTTVLQHFQNPTNWQGQFNTKVSFLLAVTRNASVMEVTYFPVFYV